MVTASEASAYSAKGHQLLVDGDDIYCVAPGEDGRHWLVHHAPGAPAKVVVRAPYEVRSKVQGYGGGAVCSHDGWVYFVNGSDQRIYRCSAASAPVPITAAGPFAHGDLSFDAVRRRIVCVREVSGAARHPETQIVSIDLDAGGLVRVLASGRDFYACPRMDCRGDRLAWITWDAPNMPWNRSRLQVGRLDADGLLTEVQDIVDRSGVSVIEPTWSPHGKLLYLSDETGYWSLHEAGSHGSRIVLAAAGAELGFPPYVLGMTTYGLVEGRDGFDVYALAWMVGEQVLLKRAYTSTSPPERVEVPYDYLSHLCASTLGLCFLGETRSHAPKPVRFDVEGGAFCEVGDAAYDMQCAAPPSVATVRFPTRDGQTGHAILYTPTPVAGGDAPHPLIVNVHGGPTGAAFVRFDPTIEFWLARGFAWLDVNHRGSTGFGRAYRESLNGRWGELDVQDCIDAVDGLCAEGIADPRRVVIRGASAGGYTALRALATSDRFAAASCIYGVSDLERLCATTHKFEAHYLHHLVGDLLHDRDRYRARSPVHDPTAIKTPVLFIQGMEDSVVPRDQTIGMSELLERSGQIAPCIEFAGEGHGLSNPANRAAAISAENLFFARVIGTSWHRDVSHPAVDAVEAYFKTRRPCVAPIP
jgi:dipeptidyl aminopeptidase/acylaminoacyl peptidase